MKVQRIYLYLPILNRCAVVLEVVSAVPLGFGSSCCHCYHYHCHQYCHRSRNPRIPIPIREPWTRGSDSNSLAVFDFVVSVAVAVVVASVLGLVLVLAWIVFGLRLCLGAVGHCHYYFSCIWMPKVVGCFLSWTGRRPCEPRDSKNHPHPWSPAAFASLRSVAFSCAGSCVSSGGRKTGDWSSRRRRGNCCSGCGPPVVFGAGVRVASAPFAVPVWDLSWDCAWERPWARPSDPEETRRKHCRKRSGKRSVERWSLGKRFRWVQR